MHKMYFYTFYAFEMQNEERTGMRIYVGSFNLKSKNIAGLYSRCQGQHIDFTK